MQSYGRRSYDPKGSFMIGLVNVIFGLGIVGARSHLLVRVLRLRLYVPPRSRTTRNTRQPESRTNNATVGSLQTRQNGPDFATTTTF